MWSSQASKMSKALVSVHQTRTMCTSHGRINGVFVLRRAGCLLGVDHNRVVRLEQTLQLDEESLERRPIRHERRVRKLHHKMLKPSLK